MDFGKCSECRKYKMLAEETDLCTGCLSDSNKDSFYKQGIRESNENIEIEDLESWFDETVPFSDYKITDRYWLVEPYCYSTIAYSNTHDKYWYLIREPEMTRMERILMDSITERVNSIYNSNPIVDESYQRLVSDRIDLVSKSVDRAKEAYNIELDSKSIKKVKYYLSRDIVLYDKITGLTMDDNINFIKYDMDEDFVTVDHLEYGEMPTTASFSDTKLDKFTRTISKRMGEELEGVNPEVNGELQDGIQLRAAMCGDFSPYVGGFTMDTSDMKHDVSF